LLEARLAGADAALLILALVGEFRAAELLAKCRQLGLSALVEVYDEQELAMAVRIGAELIGVNNRNLKTLEISLETSNRLAQLPRGKALLLSESGLSNGAQVKALKTQGCSGFLIGTTFMKTEDPGSALAKLLWEAR
jgi:indole-3-glycerol phosphate synthase